jgi:hypothetical protein
MRRFRAGSGFPPALKTRYNLGYGKPVRPPDWPNSIGKAFHAKSAIGRAKFSAYMLLTHQ